MIVGSGSAGQGDTSNSTVFEGAQKNVGSSWTATHAEISAESRTNAMPLDVATPS